MSDTPTPPPPTPPPPPSYGSNVPSPGGGGPQDYSPWVNRVGAHLLRGIVTLPYYVVGWFIDSVDGGVFTLLAYVFYIASAVVGIRLIIQRGHLGYDSADAVLGQTLISEPSGAPLGSGWTVFGRGILHILDAFPCLLGFIWPLWDQKRQTFADKIMNTVVVEGHQHQHDAGGLFKNSLELWKPVIKD